MKPVIGVLTSSRLTVVIMALFAISIAIATFVENIFDSTTARLIVYNARWFELLLLVGAINLAGNIVRNNLYRKETFTVFLFHLAFVFILAGAAVTRYTGTEGTVSVREGQSTEGFLTANTYVQVKANNGENTKTWNFPVSLNTLNGKRFRKKIHYANKAFTLTSMDYIPNAVEVAEADSRGIPVVELVYADSVSRKSVVIASGETVMAGNIPLVMDKISSDSLTVMLFALGDSLVFMAPFTVSTASMGNGSYALLEAKHRHRFYPGQLYSFRNTMLVLTHYYYSGQKVARSSVVESSTNTDAVILKLGSDKESAKITLWGALGERGQPVNLTMDGVDLEIHYGSVEKKLPICLKLNDFIIRRYPGSQSPSSFESLVSITDKRTNETTNQRIFMNNVLKYKGYRFFQMSYHPDERGTILSVSHDLAGTSITYAGYLLMGLGMLFSLFNRNSRFRRLSSEVSALKKAGKGLVVCMLFLSVQSIYAAQESLTTRTFREISKEHARMFGSLLIQDNGGRIEPVNTLSSEILRKLYRNDKYNGLNSDQVFLGMMADPYTWQHEPLIRASHPEIMRILGTESRYHPFSSFFNNDQYRLLPYVEQAYRKRPASRSKFDSEIIRLDERINIAYLVFSGELFRVLPVPGDTTYTWYNHQSIHGKVHTADSVVINHVLSHYVFELQESMNTGDWSKPNEIIQVLAALQQQHSGNVIPSLRKIKLEILLNESNVFQRLSGYYGVIGLVLLFIQFAGLLIRTFKVNIPVMTSSILIIILFIIHTIGLGLRWYVAGHAPWSNGYEALIYIAWATILAGLLFVSRSSITLSVTAVLACLILNMAHMSWMDPQITNLVPVLQSRWLIIHVATITASYGFLALGALLAYINMILMIMQTRAGREHITTVIHELVLIIEMSLIVGLYLLTAGAFLGGIWANESWGRYWGWDPKETWALVTILVYAFILHMRLVPGMKSRFAFNLAALLGFGSVIMTYFGVNYYLSGLHSYAKGDPFPIPAYVYYTLGVILITALAAYFKSYNLEKRPVKMV